MIRVVRSTTLRRLERDRDGLALKVRGDAKRIEQLRRTLDLYERENAALRAVLSLRRITT